MTFGYYDRLTPAQQRLYRRSDAITSLPLPGAASLRPLVAELADSLESAGRAAVQGAAQRLFSGLTRAFAVPPCRVEVLAARPHGRWGELQGLYTTASRARSARVQLWMRTARRRRVVAFRTFLRTLLHELVHHLDYEHLRLADSFHTQGFYQRESSLFHQLVREPRPGSSSSDRPSAREATPARSLAPPTAPGPPGSVGGERRPQPARERMTAARRAKSPGAL